MFTVKFTITVIESLYKKRYNKIYIQNDTLKSALGLKSLLGICFKWSKITHTLNNLPNIILR
jgi:hypothetical protein